MTLDHALRGSAVLLATTGFAGLLLARSLPIWLTGMTLATLSYAVLRWAGWPSSRRHGGLPSPPLIWNTLLISAFVLFVVDLTTISRDLLPAGIHFLVLLLNVKLLTLHDRRDYRHLYAISLMAVLASAALTTDLWYLSVFSLYVLAAVWSLLLCHLTSSPPTAVPSGQSGHPQPITRDFFWIANGIALSTFALTLLVFFLLPRVSVGILQKPRAEGLRTTGFSERVDLGMIGSIKENPQIVMRVELPDQPRGSRERFYLRGLAFDQYNGRSWSSGSRQRRSLGIVADGTFVVRSGANRSSASFSEPLRQDILLEALDTSALFAAPFAESLSGEFVGVQLDSTMGLHLPYPSTSRIRYSVMSRDHRLLPSEQSSAALDYAAGIRERYLQLPRQSEAIEELARRITQEMITPYEKTTAVLQHLLSNYTYSLEADTGTSGHPIDDFLFTRKTGYCEHYATAMVLMLRSLGIPSRLVTGFLATEWNDFGNYYTVRQRDAHAWVEVYYPQSGWITMDPTPLLPTPPGPTVFAALQRLAESARLYWDRAFIRYSGRDQLDFVNALRGSSDSARNTIAEWTSAMGAICTQLLRTTLQHVPTLHGSLVWTLVLGVAVAIMTLILAFSARWPYGRLEKGPSERTQQQIVQLYKKMLQVSAGRGIPITPSTTPTEIPRLVRERWEVAEPMVARVTSVYCRARFGIDSLSPNELMQAVQDLNVLKRLARRHIPDNKQ